MIDLGDQTFDDFIDAYDFESPYDDEDGQGEGVTVVAEEEVRHGDN